MSGEQLKILHAPSDSSPFLVVFKPAGIPSAPLFEGDESVLTETIRYFPQIALVHGKKEVEHGLVHRIDTETAGLVLIATTQESFDKLIQSQKDGKFEKWYRADVDHIPECAEILGGFPPAPNIIKNQFVVESAFRPFGQKGREVRPVTQNAGRAALKKGGSAVYQTEISFESENVAICHIKSGFRHQVRCHLAWCGFPVKGDKIYNPNFREKLFISEHAPESHEMKFTAFKISFPHPLTQIPLVFQM